jgi:hypothetical protein
MRSKFSSGFESGGGQAEQLPKVTVQEITDEHIEALREGKEPKGIDLGGAHSESARNMEAVMEGLLSESKEKSERKFLLTWKGSRIPSGARVLDQEIQWTQNGMVTTTSGKFGESIGTYERLVDSGGPEGNEQKMLVYLRRGK